MREVGSEEVRGEERVGLGTKPLDQKWLLSPLYLYLEVKGEGEGLLADG